MTRPALDSQIAAVRYAARVIKSDPVHSDLLAAAETLQRLKVGEESQSVRTKALTDVLRGAGVAKRRAK